MPVRSAKQRQEELARRKARGEERRGDRTAGHSKDKPPQGGRNAGGRGRGR